jgi:hypothetical protein
MLTRHEVTPILQVTQNQRIFKEELEGWVWESRYNVGFCLRKWEQTMKI